MLYSKYRVIKCKMSTRLKKIQFNVNEDEYLLIKEWADLRKVSMAEVLRECIKTFPEKIESYLARKKP